ncbi:GNAT family N-acetyltransferase [Microbacterium flavum]|uniref:GNAT family N-acetyltransferase n=1 Tax=Microbacterium flavum TaxID=415216 RepID=A0ABS5XRC7_9MICO|nr:GNAT family N-acetyltransferase [Microbacterium flavum]MBT8796521.1 GNAT family N-acetyltransferase [Microbacterium flavum]
MSPFPLPTERLMLDQPTDADVDTIAGFCTDPVFERFMVTPWPYEREHAVGFVDEYVPAGWAQDTEWTWAIRAHDSAPLLGVLSVRKAGGMVGYWLGAPHRGHGILPEALGAVIDAVFARTELDRVRWECTVGNLASMRVAQKCGFRFTGEHTGRIPARDGSPILAWNGELLRTDDRTPKPGWPDGVEA